MIFVIFCFFSIGFLFQKILPLEADHHSASKRDMVISIWGMSWGSHIQDEKITTKNIFNFNKNLLEIRALHSKIPRLPFLNFLVAPLSWFPKRHFKADNHSNKQLPSCRGDRHGAVSKRGRSDGTVVSCSGPGSRASLPKRL